MAVFYPKGFFPPMTPAERQRRCRANGKGKHRGRRYTRADYQRFLAQQALAAQAASEGSTPEGSTLPSPVPAAELVAAPPAPAYEPSISAMAA